MTELEIQQAQAALNDISTRRAAVYQEFRGAIDPPPEFFGRLRALDLEAQHWRVVIAQHEQPEPEYLPPWGKRLWLTMLHVQADMLDLRDERRRERLDDMRERDQARQTLIRWLIMATLVLAVFVAVLEALR